MVTLHLYSYATIINKEFGMLDDFKGGIELEKKIKTFLEQHNFSFKKEALLTPFNLKVDFLIRNDSNDFFVLEVSKRNSNDDIQRLCFRSSACKQFHPGVKTVLLIPAFKGKRSLKLYGLVLRFFDFFLFEEDLNLLPELLGPNSKEVFRKIVVEKLSNFHPDFRTILEALKEHKFLTSRELSEKTGLPNSRVRSLLKDWTFNLQVLGLVDNHGYTYFLTSKLA